MLQAFEYFYFEPEDRRHEPKDNVGSLGYIVSQQSSRFRANVTVLKNSQHNYQNKATKVESIVLPDVIIDARTYSSSTFQAFRSVIIFQGIP